MKFRICTQLIPPESFAPAVTGNASARAPGADKVPNAGKAGTIAFSA